MKKSDGGKKMNATPSNKRVIATKKVVKPKEEEIDTTGRLSPDDEFLGWKTGVVKAFDSYSAKGFGFLYDSQNNEYFCHYSNIQGAGGYRNLAKGQHVKFMGWNGKKGLYATSVTLVVLGGDPRKTMAVEKPKSTKIYDVEDDE